MASDPSFAPPLGRLATPTLSPPGVVVDPAGGQGFSLDERGSIPVATKDGTWRLEYVTTSEDFPNFNAHAGGVRSTTISGLAVGDLCFLLGATGGVGMRQLIIRTEPVCTTAAMINMWVFNAADVAVDSAATTLNFLVIHRFL